MSNTVSRLLFGVNSRDTIILMLKYVAIALLVFPVANAQARSAQSNQSQPRNAPQLTATPLDSPNTQTPNTGSQAASSQPPEANGQADIAKAAQATSDRIATATVIIAVFGVLSFFATCGYIIAAFLQWGSIRKQANKTNEQVIEMKGQRQAMQGQAAGMAAQARTMRESLLETRKMTEAMQEQLKAMERQWQTSNRQIELMALSECAYVTIGDWNIDMPIHEQHIRDYLIVVDGRFLNRGRTPALNFRRKIQIAAGKGSPPPDWGKFDWESCPSDQEGALLAANDDLGFSTPPLKVNDHKLTEIEKGDRIIVVDGQCRYFDILGDEQVFTFGVTIELNPRRALVRYQDYRREKAGSKNPS